jgi:hypothetical protein
MSGKAKTDAALKSVPERKETVFSLTEVLKSAKGEPLKLITNEDAMREDSEVTPEWSDTTVREAILLSLEQGPDLLVRMNQPPMGDIEKLEAHALAVAVGNRERTGFPFNTDDKKLIRRLSNVRLPARMHCALTLHLDPNAVKSRE